MRIKTSASHDAMRRDGPKAPGPADHALERLSRRRELDADMLVDPTTVLTRRVKQGIAEWYSLGHDHAGSRRF